MKNNILPVFKESQWFHQLYMQSPVAIAIYLGQEHIIDMANPAMCEIWGRSFEQVSGKPLFAALPEVAQQGFEEILAKVLESGEPFSGNELPATLERKGHINLCYFNILYKPLLDANQSIIGIIQVANEVTALVKARQLAERNEEILKISLEAGKMSTWYIDFVQDITTRSAGYEAIFGYDTLPSEWDIDMLWDHFLEEDRTFARQSYVDSKRTGSLDLEARIRWPDQSIHWIHIKGQTSFNLKGQAVSMSGVIMDISEQKEKAEKERLKAIEEATRQEEKRHNDALQQLFMHVPALIVTLRGPNHTFDLVNPSYQQLFKHRPLQGKPILEALPELKDQSIIKILDKVLRTGETYIGREIPVLLDLKNSGKLDTHYFTFVYQAMRDSEGSVSGILVFAFEVSDQINARKQAERNEERLRIALEAGEMGTWNLDLINNTYAHSLQHAYIFGYKEKSHEWDFEQLLSHISPKDRKQVQSQFEEAKQSGQLTLEVRILVAQQEERWIAIKGKTFYEAQQAVRMTGVIMDITRTKQKNLDLERINTDLDNFVYTASHDLRAPITNLEGLMIALRDTILTKTDKRENLLLEMVDTSIKKLNKTITDLVEFTKIQHEAPKIAREEVSFYEIFEEVRPDVQHLIDKVRPEIKLNFQVPTIVYKRSNLRSIFYNLFSNAVKYYDPDRQPIIEINTYLEDEGVVLSFKDNGLGLSHEQQQKLFQMFKRLHNHVEGTGIGLYTIKRMIENNGGSLAVNSSLDQGSEFVVHFFK